MGPWEIGLIVVAILVVFGAGRLAGVGKALGQGIREFREEAAKPSDDGEDSDEGIAAEETEKVSAGAESSGKDADRADRKDDA